ncbi:Protein of unknown function [Bacillus wiedmannii]|nr:Protein of unknown function [Bacillus wiedmannii]
MKQRLSKLADVLVNH